MFAIPFFYKTNISYVAVTACRPINNLHTLTQRPKYSLFPQKQGRKLTERDLSWFSGSVLTIQMLFSIYTSLKYMPVSVFLQQQMMFIILVKVKWHMHTNNIKWPKQNKTTRTRKRHNHTLVSYFFVVFVYLSTDQCSLPWSENGIWETNNFIPLCISN